MNSLSTQQQEQLLQVLQTRFEANMARHHGMVWETVDARLRQKPDMLWSLSEMERTGGEPDVVVIDTDSSPITFYDCALESPKGRRSICYDREALEARKQNKPETSVMDVVRSMGIELLDETQYRKLQEFGPFDIKTSSWILTPSSIRSLGGALFCDYRYGTVFTYHNGADSYYSSRGFRGCLTL